MVMNEEQVAGLIEESSELREGIEEAIKILSMYDRSCKISMCMAMSNTKKFLRSNFDLDK